MQFRPVEPRLLHAAALAFWLLACTALQGCRGPDPVIPASVGATMALTSTSFQNGRIPPTFTCDGADQSPPLAWTTPPAATKSLALVVTDPDAPFGVFTHWLLYNLPPATRQLTQGMEKVPQLYDGSRQGQNDFDRIGYGGPCPPRGFAHRYIFRLYALDTPINLAPGGRRNQLESAMRGHVVAEGELIARYGR